MYPVDTSWLFSASSVKTPTIAVPLGYLDETSIAEDPELEVVWVVEEDVDVFEPVPDPVEDVVPVDVEAFVDELEPVVVVFVLELVLPVPELEVELEADVVLPGGPELVDAVLLPVPVVAVVETLEWGP